MAYKPLALCKTLSDENDHTFMDSNKYEIYPLKTCHLMWSNYSYIVVDKVSRFAFIIDPAWELMAITQTLEILHIDVKAILLTHSHYDHINLVDPLVKMYNPSVYMSKREIDYYEFRCRNLNALSDNETLCLGETEAQSLLTPGHTAGSMCYLFSTSLFTGDTIFIEGCGICTEKGGSAVNMFVSLQRIKSQIPLHVRVYPGHSYGKNPGQTIQSLLKENIYFQIEKEEHFINFRMRKNQTTIFDFK